MHGERHLIFIELGSGKRLDTAPCPLVLATGNFDGVHLGHKSLIEKAVSYSAELASKTGQVVKSGVFCFSEPPADYLMPTPPAHISTLMRKLDLFSELGAEYAVIASFPHFRDLSPEEFIVFLKNDCYARAIVCGFNFTFGRFGRGDGAMLKEGFGENAFVMPAVRSEDGEVISSSRIRTLAENGDIETVNALLGRPFTITERVKRGKALGRRLGLPTINQNFAEKALIPKPGIYISETVVGGVAYMSVSNIGKRPTVEVDGRINCETHLLDYEGELYGEDISVRLLKRTRDEKKFSSEEELREAICLDVLTAREYFKNKK
ncbi:MAG: riboflavin biosynthesis protein RibF [Clostridia bacterium]|nr:riboflavin biosynthesis protein RibF [Clostridia bacterium]